MWLQLREEKRHRIENKETRMGKNQGLCTRFLLERATFISKSVSKWCPNQGSNEKNAKVLLRSLPKNVSYEFVQEKLQTTTSELCPIRILWRQWNWISTHKEYWIIIGISDNSFGYPLLPEAHARLTEGREATTATNRVQKLSVLVLNEAAVQSLPG